MFGEQPILDIKRAKHNSVRTRIESSCLKAANVAGILSLIILFASFAQGTFALTSSSSTQTRASFVSNVSTTATSLARLEIWNPDVHSSNITNPNSFPVGSQFSVRVNVTNPIPVSGFDVTLNYNITLGPNILQAVRTGYEMAGGLFDPDHPPSGCLVFVAKSEIDIPPGRIRFLAALGGSCTKSSSGTLFTITFRVTGMGAGFIDIVSTNSQGQPVTIIASSPPNVFSIPFTPVDARFQNVPGIPPVARFSYDPRFPLMGDGVSFAGGQSYDPDNANAPNNGISRYLWILGDGP